MRQGPDYSRFAFLAFMYKKPRHPDHEGTDVAALRVLIALKAYAKKSSERVIGSIYSPSLYTRMLPEAISSIRMTSPLAS